VLLFDAHEAADAAMYEAKRHGGRQYALARPSSAASTPEPVESYRARTPLALIGRFRMAARKASTATVQP
jgi:hypothetical protein